MKLAGADGVYVEEVTKESAAAKAGLKAGDVITAIGDKSIKAGDALVSQLSDKTGQQLRRRVIVRGIGAQK